MANTSETETPAVETTVNLKLLDQAIKAEVSRLTSEIEERRHEIIGLRIAANMANKLRNK